MTVSAQAATFSFGPQAGMGLAPTSWYKHRATFIDLNEVDETREGPPEIGGIAVPTFPYKPGPVVAGGFTLQPRFQNTFGWLLYGMLGNLTSTPVVGNTDVIDHAFTLPAQSTYVPWMGFRKHIPQENNDATSDLGQLFTDCKIVGGTIALPNDGPPSFRADVIGRLFALDHAPDAWTYENEFEDWESIPVGCETSGYLKIDDVEFPVVQATIGWANVPLDLRQERVYGSPYLDDVTIVQRRLTYDMVVKWHNPDLYAELLTGTATGTTWSSSPKTAALDVLSVSSVDMPSETERYSLRIEADEVMMSQVGGLSLAGNQSVMMRFAGVALEATDYATFTLRNKVEEYVWPTPAS